MTIVATFETDPLTEAFLAMGSIVADSRDLYFGFLLRLPGIAPPLSALRDQVAERLPELPVLTRQLVRHYRGSRWEPEIRASLRDRVSAGPPLPDGIYPAAALLRTLPDPDRPNWGLWLLPGQENDWGVCFLVHHAIQDAVGALDTLRTLFGPGSQIESAGRSAVPPVPVGLGAVPAILAGHRRACCRRLRQRNPVTGGLRASASRSTS